MSAFRLPDPYEGMTAEQLKNRCKKLARAYSEWQMIAVNLAATPGALERLHPEHRTRVQLLMDTYSD